MQAPEKGSFRVLFFFFLRSRKFPTLYERAGALWEFCYATAPAPAPAPSHSAAHLINPTTLLFVLDIHRTPHTLLFLFLLLPHASRSCLLFSLPSQWALCDHNLSSPAVRQVRSVHRIAREAHEVKSPTSQLREKESSVDSLVAASSHQPRAQFCHLRPRRRLLLTSCGDKQAHIRRSAAVCRRSQVGNNAQSLGTNPRRAHPCAALSTSPAADRWFRS